VVLDSQATQGAPAEEQQQWEEDHNVDNEDEDDEEYSPLSNNEGEKLYRNANERESFGAEPRSLLVGFVPCWDTWASPPPQDIRPKESSVQDGWNSR
jgi:hypothetical protein